MRWHEWTMGGTFAGVAARLDSGAHLLDVAERGRSLGIILIGAQQTASEVERRIVANSAVRVVGRLGFRAGDFHRGHRGPAPPTARQA